MKTKPAISAKSKARSASSSPNADLLEKIVRMEIELRTAEFQIRLKDMQLEELKQENSVLRRGRSATEDLLRGEIRKRDSEIVALRTQLEIKDQQLEWFQRQKFDKTSEKEKRTNQTAHATKPALRPKGQKTGTPGPKRNSKSEVPTVVKFIDIPGGCSCGVCGTKYRLLARTEASPLTEIDVKILRTIFQRAIYVSQCDCEGKKIRVANPPSKIIPRTEIGNSLWVWLLVQKFLHGMPQNRILKQLSLWGLALPAGTATGGYKVIDNLLGPLYEAMVDHCRGADFWNADETTWRVFGQDKQRWWFWLVASDDTVVYLLDPSRSQAVPTEFFAGSTGILLTDRFSSYKALQKAIRKAWCWAHLRRDIFNVYMSIPQLKTWAKGWLKEIAILYVLNHKRFALWQQDSTDAESWMQADSELKKHVAKLQKLWESEVSKPNLQKAKAKILRSMKRHWSGLTIFLEDPRVPLDNNRAERLLRNPVILRKNSFGSGAPWAGHFAAKVFSIFQTWLINGLDPEKLLQEYLNQCSQMPGKPPPDQYLPWKMSEKRKNMFSLPPSYSQPG